MHDDRLLIEGRLARTLQRIEDAVWSSPVEVDLASWEAPGEPVPVAEGLAAAYEPAHVGQVIFRVGIVPFPRIAGPERVFIELKALGCDAAENHRAEASVPDRQRVGPLLRRSRIPEYEVTFRFGGSAGSSGSEAA